jgi:hypothetical protein
MFIHYASDPVAKWRNQAVQTFFVYCATPLELSVFNMTIKFLSGIANLFHLHTPFVSLEILISVFDMILPTTDLSARAFANTRNASKRSVTWVLVSLAITYILLAICVRFYKHTVYFSIYLVFFVISIAGTNWIGLRLRARLIYAPSVPTSSMPAAPTLPPVVTPPSPHALPPPTALVAAQSSSSSPFFLEHPSSSMVPAIITPSSISPNTTPLTSSRRLTPTVAPTTTTTSSIASTTSGVNDYNTNTINGLTGEGPRSPSPVQRSTTLTITTSRRGSGGMEGAAVAPLANVTSPVASRSPSYHNRHPIHQTYNTTYHTSLPTTVNNNNVAPLSPLPRGTTTTLVTVGAANSNYGTPKSKGNPTSNTPKATSPSVKVAVAKEGRNNVATALRDRIKNFMVGSIIISVIYVILLALVVGSARSSLQFTKQLLAFG